MDNFDMYCISSEVQASPGEIVVMTLLRSSVTIQIAPCPKQGTLVIHDLGNNS